jgi:hypothetical protein
VSIRDLVVEIAAAGLDLAHALVERDDEGTKRPVCRIIRQRADGFWNLDRELAAVLGRKLDELNQRYAICPGRGTWSAGCERPSSRSCGSSGMPSTRVASGSCLPTRLASGWGVWQLGLPIVSIGSGWRIDSSRSEPLEKLAD